MPTRVSVRLPASAALLIANCLSSPSSASLPLFFYARALFLRRRRPPLRSLLRRPAGTRTAALPKPPSRPFRRVTSRPSSFFSMRDFDAWTLLGAPIAAVAVLPTTWAPADQLVAVGTSDAEVRSARTHAHTRARAARRCDAARTAHRRSGTGRKRERPPQAPSVVVATLPWTAPDTLAAERSGGPDSGTALRVTASLAHDGAVGAIVVGTGTPRDARTRAHGGVVASEPPSVHGRVAGAHRP